jgi:hypothetical protein
VPIEAADTAAVVVGIYVRPYPTASQPDKVRQIGSGYNFAGDCMKRGYVTVNLGADASSVTLGGAVFMRVATRRLPVRSAHSWLPLTVRTLSRSLTLISMVPGDTSGNIELAFNI